MIVPNGTAINNYRIERLSHTSYTVTCGFENGDIAANTVKTFDSPTPALENALGRAAKMSLLLSRPVHVIMADGRILTVQTELAQGEPMDEAELSPDIPD